MTNTNNPNSSPDSILDHIIKGIYVIILFYLIVGWFLFPAAPSKIYMFWKNDDPAYSIIDKVALAAKVFIYPYYYTPNKEEIEKRLDEDIKEYIKHELAQDSKAYSTKRGYHFSHSILKERHFIYDNNYLFGDFEYYLKLFVEKCNNLPSQELSIAEYNLKANFCNDEIDDFKQFRQIYTYKLTRTLKSGNLLYPIRKEISSYLPLNLKEEPKEELIEEIKEEPADSLAQNTSDIPASDIPASDIPASDSTSTTEKK